MEYLGVGFASFLAAKKGDSNSRLSRNGRVALRSHAGLGVAVLQRSVALTFAQTTATAGNVAMAAMAAMAMVAMARVAMAMATGAGVARNSLAATRVS